MTIKTTAELISEIDAAISEALKAQQMGMGDKLLQRARLKDLFAARSELMAQYRAEQGTGGPAVNTGLIYRG